MGMFMPEDKEYDEEVRQKGFNRYRQLLGRHFGAWFKINLLTILGFLPLAIGIFTAILSSSILILIPCSLFGGAIAGPFLAGMYDSLFRAFRDDPSNWKTSYFKSWRQNLVGSLLPGALLGLMLGFFTFMGMLFWWSDRSPTPGTIFLFAFSILLTLVITELYWPQFVLFNQRPILRIRNLTLFTIKYFKYVFGAALLQLVYWALYFFLAPWTLLLLPILGIWYILFLSELILYRHLDEAFQIEQQFYENES